MKMFGGLLNSPLLFGATALGQQVDMWLVYVRPNLLRYRSANFTYPQNVVRNARTPQKFRKVNNMINEKEGLIAYCTVCGSSQGVFQDEGELRRKIAEPKKMHIMRC